MGFEVAEKVSLRGKIQKHLKSFLMEKKKKHKKQKQLVLKWKFPKKKKRKKISSQISVRKKGKRKCSPLRRSVFRGIVLASALVIKLFKGLAQKKEQFVLLPHGQAHWVFSKTNLSTSVTSGCQDHTTSPRNGGGWGVRHTPKCQLWDFPGSPVVMTQQFQCRGHRFNPRSGN